MKTHVVLVTIKTLDDQTKTEAADRVHRWLETFGHTACSHGFAFESATPVTLSRARRKKLNKEVV